MAKDVKIPVAVPAPGLYRKTVNKKTEFAATCDNLRLTAQRLFGRGKLAKWREEKDRIELSKT